MSGHRREHRQRALAFQTLYGHALDRAATEEQLAALYAHAAQTQGLDASLQGFGWSLALGAWQKEKELNAVMERFARNRPLGEIGRLEQVLLRLGLYEIIYQFTEPKIVMSESMILAEEFAAGPGGKFVNGVLDAATRNLSAIRGEAHP